MLEILESQLAQAAPSQADDEFGFPEDPEANRYQFILNLILEESEAAAILLVKDNQPLAFVGDVDTNSPTHVMNIIMQHWNAERRSDVVRFKRLQDGGKDYLFYATAIHAELILVVVYERTISLTSARLHTSAVIRKIKNPPAAWMVNQNKITAQQQSSNRMSRSAEPETAVLTTDDLDWLDEEDDFEGLGEAEMINLEALLASMPNPDPNSGETELMDPYVDRWQTESASYTVIEPQIEEQESSPAEEYKPVSPFLETDHFTAEPTLAGIEAPAEEKAISDEVSDQSIPPDEAESNAGSFSGFGVSMGRTKTFGFW